MIVTARTPDRVTVSDQENPALSTESARTLPRSVVEPMLRTEIEAANQRAEIAEAKLRAEQHTASQLREQVEFQRTRPVTRGDDPRLTEFWELAAEEAESQGFCEEYDRICAELGGRGREREMKVRVTAEIIVTVTARDEDTAREDAAELVGTTSELLTAINNGDVELDELLETELLDD